MHIAVLKKEVLEYLSPKPNENFIDCTVGEGRHATAILEKNKPNGKVLGIDLDDKILKKLELQITGYKLQDRLILVNDSYINLTEIVEKYKFEPLNGILFDLGMSSWHLEESGKGFSFLKDEPLDMRYCNKIFNFQFSIFNNLTAEEIVNQYPQKELEDIIKNYGEERFAGKIAKEIIEIRRIKPIKTTFQLIEIIRNAVPKNYQKGKINFATRTFQALRIAVNDELNNLIKVLPQAIEVLSKGGRLAVISFHSLEDRIIKNFFKNLPSEKFEILTKKPIKPSLEEIISNPRSRSAKMRAILKRY